MPPLFVASSVSLPACRVVCLPGLQRTCQNLPPTRSLRAGVVTHRIVPTLLTMSSRLDTLLVLHLVLGLGNASLEDAGVSKFKLPVAASHQRRICRTTHPRRTIAEEPQQLTAVGFVVVTTQHSGKLTHTHVARWDAAETRCRRGRGVLKTRGRLLHVSKKRPAKCRGATVHLRKLLMGHLLLLRRHHSKLLSHVRGITAGINRRSRVQWVLVGKGVTR